MCAHVRVVQEQHTLQQVDTVTVESHNMGQIAKIIIKNIEFIFKYLFKLSMH